MSDQTWDVLMIVAIGLAAIISMAAWTIACEKLMAVKHKLSVLQSDMWRIAQGVADPEACAKASLLAVGIDYDSEQAKLAAQHAAEGCACAGGSTP